MDEDGEKELALQACQSCRKDKRKCDKKLPTCSLCLRLSRSCDYSIDSQANPPSADDFTTLRQQIADLQDLILSQSKNATPSTVNGKVGGFANGNSPNKHGSNGVHPSTELNKRSFPSIFFLDSKLCHYMYTGLTVRPPHIDEVPATALHYLGSSKDLQSMVEHYFDTTHTYLPVISKIRLYQHLVDPAHEPDAILVLLFLAMKLVCSPLVEGESAPTLLYRDVKAFSQFIEMQNGLSIRSIQALLLIALYEIGHGIYPAAYLSAGKVARVGYACGLHDEKSTQILLLPTRWTEQEERRRLWWGIVILDRFVNIGTRGKPFATTDPDIETHHPTDDDSWDRGQMLVAAPLSLSASPTVAASPFARTCQATYLLGKMLRHIDDNSIPMEYRFDEALQLHRTMRAFAGVLDHGSTAEVVSSSPGPLATSLAIIYSALLTLYDAYSCTESARQGGGEAQLRMQKESIEGLRDMSARVLGFSQRLRAGIAWGDLECRLSPMIVDSIYQAAANYAWYVRESSDVLCGERLQELKQLLLMIEGRWKVAGEYHRIVQSWESSLVLGSW